jgi:hypothetical protein
VVQDKAVRAFFSPSFPSIEFSFLPKKLSYYGSIWVNSHCYVSSALGKNGCVGTGLRVWVRRLVRGGDNRAHLPSLEDCKSSFLRHHFFELLGGEKPLHTSSLLRHVLISTAFFFF